METIDRLKQVGFFGPIDVQLAGLVARMHAAGDPPGALLLAVALASRAIRGGHACVNLEDFAGREWADVLKEHLPASRDAGDADETGEPEPGDQSGVAGSLPDLETWKQSSGKPAIGDGSENGPDRTLLVLRGHRLYLRRYWEYERKVEARLKALNVPSGKSANSDALTKYFNASEDSEQLAAARNAIEKRLSLLSGGPGTGKTYTLAAVVALLTETAETNPTPLEICMAAPTGKAAVRMTESITDAKARLKDKGAPEEVLEKIPEKATTIHRLLGAQYHSPYFKHYATKPLSADIVIVDEASMVDLPLMAKLLDALPKDCRLMLVGDIDQLASVEPGRVYGDVCRAAGDEGPLNGCLTRLTKSRRFPETSAIGQISRRVNAGNANDAWAALQQWNGSGRLDVHDAETLHQPAHDTFPELVKDQMRAFLETSDETGALDAANRFRILCAVRKGPYGVLHMNRRVERILAGQGLKPGKRFYDHQIIMIKVNTPALHLYNGDVGVVLKAKGEEKDVYRAWFPDAEQGPRAVPVSLLPDHETAFAMTVHKAQGSEFPCVALVLPSDADSPALSRELLYTGLTRVKIDEENNTGKLSLWCTENSFRNAVEAKTTRVTGLFQ